MGTNFTAFSMGIQNFYFCRLARIIHILIGIIPKEKPKVLTVRDVKRQSEQRKEFHKTRKDEMFG